ncbi:MAG: DUF962 domain-containing protein [Sandaracinaceae bacterium]|nr:DUF962 domain-containing protein [Sandaracinaceae bacterium]
MSEAKRFQSFSEFWPYYLSEHRNPTSRRLHFLGTSGWLAACAASTAAHPVRFPLAMAGFAGVFWHGAQEEGMGRSLKHVAAMIAIPSSVAPVTFPAGVAFAYGCAWTGHFGMEKNTPATFQYPLWSLLGDLRMWTMMARGKLWSGDPLEELGLEDHWRREDPDVKLTTHEVGVAE